MNKEKENVTANQGTNQNLIPLQTKKIKIKKKNGEGKLRST